jgi:phosphoribosylanthranilate isomerase
MSFFEPGPLRVKICGISNPEDAAMAVDAGADALGFNFYPGSKRFIPFAENRDWIAALAGRVDRVAVVVNASSAELAELRDSGCFEAVQFHGDETPEDCAAARFGRWMRAVRVKDANSATHLASYATPFVLVDAWSATAYGGTGERLNWDLGRDLVLAHPDRHIVLAGGLTPTNVREAVRITRPFGVDVAGGVEADPRRKEEYLTREFVREAKKA